MFILVVLPLPPPMAFVSVQRCSRVTAVEARALCQRQHKCWHKCKCPLLPQGWAYRSSSSPLPCVSALCFPLEPPRAPRKRRWCRELHHPPLQMLEFLREAVKRLDKQDYNWANNSNNPRLQSWLGNLKGRLLMVQPTLNTGLDFLTRVTHTNPHLKAFIWHQALTFQSPLSFS